MKKRILGVTLCFAVTASILAGCGGSSAATATTVAAAGESAAAQSDGGEKAARETKAEGDSSITIGFSSKTNSDTFVKNIADAAEARAKELGINLVMMDAAGDVNKQISDCETMIAQGVDALVVIPQDVEEALLL